MPLPWLGCVRVLSLVFEEWSVDNRRRINRLEDPRLVDVGWTEAVFPSFFEQLTGSSTVHFDLQPSMINASSRVRVSAKPPVRLALTFLPSFF